MKTSLILILALIVCTVVVMVCLMELVPNGKLFYLIGLQVGLFFGLGSIYNLMEMTEE